MAVIPGVQTVSARRHWFGVVVVGRNGGGSGTGASARFDAATFGGALKRNSLFKPCHQGCRQEHTTSLAFLASLVSFLACFLASISAALRLRDLALGSISNSESEPSPSSLRS